MQDHLQQLDELSDQLTAIGEEVKELHKVAVSLQESYPTIVTMLLTKGTDELTLIVVKQALLVKEQRRCKGSDNQKGADMNIKSYSKTCKPATDAERPVTSKRIVENHLSRNHLSTHTASIELR